MPLIDFEIASMISCLFMTVNQAFPSLIHLECRTIAYYEEEVARPSNSHVNAPLVLEEAQARVLYAARDFITPHTIKDDYVLLTTLVRIHRVDFNVVVSAIL